MSKILCRWVWVLALVVAGCSDSEEALQIVGPDLPEGPGRAYPISAVSFPSNDGVEVRALFGTAQADELLPVVLLLHDLGGRKSDWLNNTDTYVALLERGYAVLAIDMRGHGETPLPADRQVLELTDLEQSFLDVHAALVWLPSPVPSRCQPHRGSGHWLGGECSLREFGKNARSHKNRCLPLARAVGGLFARAVGHRGRPRILCPAVHALYGGRSGSNSVRGTPLSAMLISLAA